MGRTRDMRAVPRMCYAHVYYFTINVKRTRVMDNPSIYPHNSKSN
jgi:hypothetical protein